MIPGRRRDWIADNIGTRAEDFSPADLQAIADGPIVDAIRLYLPAGVLTKEEAAGRDRRIMAGEAG